MFVWLTIFCFDNITAWQSRHVSSLAKTIMVRVFGGWVMGDQRVVAPWQNYSHPCITQTRGKLFMFTLRLLDRKEAVAVLHRARDIVGAHDSSSIIYPACHDSVHGFIVCSPYFSCFAPPPVVFHPNQVHLSLTNLPFCLSYLIETVQIR